MLFFKTLYNKINYHDSLWHSLMKYSKIKKKEMNDWIFSLTQYVDGLCAAVFRWRRHISLHHRAITVYFNYSRWPLTWLFQYLRPGQRHLTVRTWNGSSSFYKMKKTPRHSARGRRHTVECDWLILCWDHCWIHRQVGCKTCRSRGFS